MTWVIAYFVVGAILATISAIHLQMNTDKSKTYKAKAILGLLFVWPPMLAYVLIIAGAFMLNGGIF